MARSDRFTEKAQTALQRTVNFAEELGHTYIGTEHLLMALIVDKETISAKVLSAHKLSLSDIKKAAIDVSGSGTPCKVRASDMTPGLRRVIEISSNEAIKYSHRHIGTEHLLYAVISESECVGAKILESLNVSLSEIKSELIGLFEGISKRSEKSDANDKKSGKSESIAGCPAISEYGKDLTKLAARGKTDPIIGREKETERVVQILSRRSKNNPCLLGEPGVGKTAIVEGLAAKIASDNVPEMLRGKIIVTLDIPSMIAGAKYRGEFEERLKNVMKEAAQNPDIILFIDEIHTIIGAGAAEGAVDAANIIKPALARGEMQIIGATTLSEYRRFIEKDAAFERRFQAVMVEEPNPEDTITILKGLSSGYEKHHRLKISEKAIEASVKLSKRYITDRFLPDKAIDLIDEAASRLRIEAHTIPPKIKEMENEIKRLSKEKEEAIISQDFERAADLRDAEKRKKDEYERS